MNTLNYRGVSYTVEPTSPEILARTQVVERPTPTPNFETVAGLPVPHPVQVLTYRGVKYEQSMATRSMKDAILLNEHIATKAATPAETVLPSVAGFQSDYAFHVTDARDVEPENRRNAFTYLQNRLKKAKAAGNDVQADMIRQEMQLLY